jgi:hypothetical protein
LSASSVRVGERHVRKRDLATFAVLKLSLCFIEPSLWIRIQQLLLLSRWSSSNITFPLLNLTICTR